MTTGYTDRDFETAAENWPDLSDQQKHFVAQEFYKHLTAKAEAERQALIDKEHAQWLEGQRTMEQQRASAAKEHQFTSADWDATFPATLSPQQKTFARGAAIGLANAARMHSEGKLNRQEMRDIHAAATSEALDHLTPEQYRKMRADGSLEAALAETAESRPLSAVESKRHRQELLGRVAADTYQMAADNLLISDDQLIETLHKNRALPREFYDQSGRGDGAALIDSNEVLAAELYAGREAAKSGIEYEVGSGLVNDRKAERERGGYTRPG